MAIRLGSLRGWAVPAGNTEHLSIDAEQDQFEDTTSDATGFQRGLQRDSDLSGERENIVFGCDRFDQATFDREARDWQPRRYRLFICPKRLIEPQEQGSSEAAGKRGAWCVQQIAHIFEPHFIQGAYGFFLEAEGRDRQRRQSLLGFPVFDDPALDRNG